MDEIIIERIQAIEIKPTDTLIIKLKIPISFQAMERLRDSLRPKFPNNNILIFEDGLEMEVYRENEKVT